MLKEAGRQRISFLALLALLSGFFVSVSDARVAYGDDTYERICLTMGWTQCGEFTIHQADGTQVNRVIGPYPLDAFLAYDSFLFRVYGFSIFQDRKCEIVGC